MDYLLIALLALSAGLLVASKLAEAAGIAQKRVSALSTLQRARKRARLHSEDASGGGRLEKSVARFRDTRLGQTLSGMIPETAAEREDRRAALSRSGLHMSTASFNAVRLLTIAMLTIIGTMAGGRLFPDDARSVAVAVLGAVIGFALPQLYLMNIRRKWRDAIERDLPNAIDLMCVSVSAGTTFEQAVRTVATNMEGELADGFQDVLAQSRYMELYPALKRFADDAGVQPLTIFAASLIDASRSGARLVDILHAQADSVRTYRRAKLEEQINKLPVKMIFPIVFCIFPALFGAVLIPALSQLMGVFAAL